MKKYILFIMLLTVSLTGMAQPSNDDPCNAMTIPLESTGCEPITTYAWTGATASTAYGNPYCINSGPKDVWYKVTIPANGKINARIAMANTYNMAVEFLMGSSCSVGGFTTLNQNTHGFPCMYASSSSGGNGNFRNLTPGATLYMRVYPLYNNNLANADIKLCVSSPNTMADEPCNAGFFDVELADPLGQNCVPTREIEWSGATLTPAIPNPSCLSSMPAANIRDVWCKVRVPASGKLQINAASTGMGNYLYTVYTASNCSSGFTEIACGNYSAVNLSNLSPNSILYLRFNSWHSSLVQPDNKIKLCIVQRNDIPGIDNSKKVGIGIDTPFAKLDVVGTGIFRDKVTAGSDLEVRGNLIVKGNILSAYGNNSMQGFNGGMDSLMLGSYLGNRIKLYGGTGNTAQYGLGVQNSKLQIYSDGSNSNIAFGYGNSFNFTERASIVQNGEVAMNINGRLALKHGTQPPGVWLSNSSNNNYVGIMGVPNNNLVGFYGNSGAGWGLTMNVANANVGIGLNGATPAKPLSFPAVLGEKILLYPGGVGEVGIGVYGNELRLHSDNPGAKVSFGTQTNAGVFTEAGKFEIANGYALTAFGSIWANGTTYASDERFKKNIGTISSPLQKLLQLKGVEYEMKADEFSRYHFTQQRQMGLLAQNVEQVVPEAVNEKDGYKGVDYARLVPLLIESIKELKQQVDELKARLDAIR